MIARVLAWGVFLALVWAGYQGVTSWKSPWAVPMPAPAVMSVLPDQPQGCGKGCL